LDAGGVCSLCNEPISGHPFSEDGHEPQSEQRTPESVNGTAGFNPDEPCPLFDEETGEIF
jgi:hypothetical protein